MKTRVVHCKKEKYDILIDRTTKWGNPFKIGMLYKGKILNREDVIEAHEDWFMFSNRGYELQKDLQELKGKVLG